MTVADLTRQEWVQLQSLAMTGSPSAKRFGFRHRPGNVRTFAIEVNGADRSDPLERLEQVGHALGMRMRPTADSSLAVLSNEVGGAFADVVDPRFWLIHATGASGWLESSMASLIGAGDQIDWCWLPVEQLEAIQGEGRTRWYKSDFRGDELLPKRGTKARRLKVQLEGDDAEELRRYISGFEGYEAAGSLTGITIVLDDQEGEQFAAAHFRGGFTGHGWSFGLYQAFVTRAVDRYAEGVRGLELGHGYRWTADDARGVTFEGRSIDINLGRPIEDLERFARGLFSSKEPFRLWGLTSGYGGTQIEADVVDLHVGQRFLMQIRQDRLHLYLGDGTCANTVYRLLTNLQHRYDATARIAAGPAGSRSEARSSRQQSDHLLDAGDS